MFDRQDFDALERRALRARRRPAPGFSLVELMVVLSIAAILLGIGVPNFQRMAVNNRLSNHTHELFGALQLARSEAVRRAASVTVAHKGTANSRDWTNGWRVFIDADNDGVFDSGEFLIRDGGAAQAPMTVFGSANFANVIVFDSTGRLSSGAGTLVICHGSSLTEDGESRARAVVVNSSGRVRIARDGNDDGVPETDTAAVGSCTNP